MRQGYRPQPIGPRSGGVNNWDPRGYPQHPGRSVDNGPEYGYEPQTFPQQERTRRTGPKRRQAVGELSRVPKMEMPSGLPQPQHLSKAPSEEKNDPLYMEAVFPGPSQVMSELP